MLAASVTLLVASDHEHRAFLPPSEAARRCTGGLASVARPHGCPQMSHVIPLHVIQTLKSDRCNSNVFSAHQKLTEGNYVRHFRGVRLFREERLAPATTPPSHRWGLPGSPPPHSRSLCTSHGKARTHAQGAQHHRPPAHLMRTSTEHPTRAANGHHLDRTPPPPYPYMKRFILIVEEQ